MYCVVRSKHIIIVLEFEFEKQVFFPNIILYYDFFCLKTGPHLHSQCWELAGRRAGGGGGGDGGAGGHSHKPRWE